MHLLGAGQVVAMQGGKGQLPPFLVPLRGLFWPRGFLVGMPLAGLSLHTALQPPQ
jgi:hypothetical protein